MEDLYIAAFDTMNKKVGYNLKRGGANGKLSKEVRDFCGKTHIGFKHSLESRRKMSESTKKSLLENPRPPISESTRQKLKLRPPRPPLSKETKQSLRERFLDSKSVAFNQEVKTEDLIRMYLEEEKSCSEISKFVPMTAGGILARLRRTGVVMRKPWEHKLKKA
jgi:hypothetical protein